MVLELPPMDEMLKGLKIGAGILLVAIVAALCWLAYDTRVKALRGDAAAAFIERVNAPQPAKPDASTAPTQEKKP